MQAVILAAGKGTRTYPLTLTKPKPLLKVANKTILEHNLEQLVGLVDEVIIVIGYRAEMIKEKIGNNFKGIKITYVKQEKQLGTGHALGLIKDKIKNRFIFMNGDDLYSKKDIQRCLEHKYSILVQKTNQPENFGIVEEKNGKLKNIIEKPKGLKTGLANCAVYVLDKKIFEIKLRKSIRGEYEAIDAIVELAKNNNVECIEVKDYWLPIPYSWSLLDANKFLLEKITKTKIKGKLEENVIIKGNIIVGKGSIIKSGSYIEGPVLIGENCEIGPFAHIRPDTTIGNNCRIGKTELVDSIIMDNTTSKHISYIGHSVIGENVNIAAGTITGDYRHDGKSNKTIVKGEKIDTGRKKLGAFIADNVNTGIGTLIYPGRKIWPNKSTKPGEIVKEDIIF